MKNKDNFDKDISFLRANMDTHEGRIELPESLKEDSIIELVSGKKQRANKRAVIKRFVSIAVAACIAVGIFVYADFFVYAPKKISVAENGVAYTQSYDDIISIVKDYAKYKKTENMLNGFSFAKASSETLSETVAGDYRDVDFAETNTRVDGIGEADVVKTDGKYLYVESLNNMIGIFKAEQDGTLTLESIIDCLSELCADGTYGIGGFVNLGEFYVYGDKLAALTDYCNYESDTGAFKQCSGVMIFDISDKTSPVLVRSVFQDGTYISSRVVGNSLIFISNYYIDGDCDAFTVENVILGVYDGGIDEKTYVNACDIAVMDVEEPDSYVVIGKIDLADISKKPETLAFFGGGCEVYCTADTLYVYKTKYPTYGFYSSFGVFSDIAATFSRDVLQNETENMTTTELLSFDISQEKPVFKAKGKIEGYLLNTYSLDDFDGYLRIAATRENDNVIYVLDNELNEVGMLDGIADGEIIKSVRFSGNTAYVVTFVQTDPLFVIDLSDPTAPVIKGEVKLPGFSSYLHPIGDGLMLGIGSGGTEEGIDGSAKISLFDVSDPEKPFEADSIIFPYAYLVTEYKAFVTVNADGSFLIPLTCYEEVSDDDGMIAYYDLKNLTGAVRISVEDGKLSLLNKYMVPFAEGGNDECRRVSYIGDTVYVIGYDPFIASFDMHSATRLFMKNYSNIFIEQYQSHLNGYDFPEDAYYASIDDESGTSEDVSVTESPVLSSTPMYEPEQTEVYSATAYTR